MKYGLILLLLFWFGTMPVSAAYGINRTINFSGKLVTPTGTNVPNSTPVTATFSLYQTNSSCPGGGTAVWSENQTFTPVDGIFQVALGSNTAFGTSIDFSQDTLYLGIQISGESSEMCSGSTRIKLASVPYAFNAESFAGLTADDSQSGLFTISGGQTTEKTLTVNGNITVGSIIAPTASGGLTLQSNGDNALVLNSAANSVSALDINATGTVAGNAITLDTSNGGIALTAGGAANGDISLSAADDINITGTAGSLINIGTVAVSQTINLGNSTDTDLVLNDANWSITGAGVASFVSGSSMGSLTFTTNNIADTGALTVKSATSNALTLDSGTTGTVNLGTGANAKTINIGTAAVANTIAIGSTSATGVSITDDNWSISSAGAAVLTGLNLGTSSFASCDLLRSDASGNVTCSTNGFNVVSAQNTNNVNWADNNTTDLWTVDANLQITVSSGSEVLVMASMQSTSVDPGSGTVSLGARVDREGAGVASDCADVNTVGTTFSMNPTHQAAGTATYVGTGSVAFVDAGTTAGGTFTYEICTDANSTVLTGTWATDVMELVLIEVNDAADLAEIYPTNDVSLTAAEVVSADAFIEGGIARSLKAYDKSLLGVVTTKPALVIGGRNGLGVDGKPVALTGRVPVKVSTVNGSIKAGDPLTSSNIPGVAMKATKAGTILGIAMRDYSDSQIGTVLTYVKTGYYTGGNLAELVKDVPEELQSQAILSHFVANEPDRSLPELSELVADRIVAGLEIISPTIYADKIIVDSLNAEKIQAGQILGLEKFIASTGGNLKNDPSTEWKSHFVDLQSQIASMAAIMQQKTWDKLLVTNGLTVTGPVSLSDHVEYGKDTAGYGVLHKGTKRVDIVFDNEYNNPPIVIINAYENNLKVVDRSSKGFAVEAKENVSEEMEFSWIAVSVNKPNRFESLVPTPEPTSIPTLIPVPTEAEIHASGSGQIDGG